MHNYFELLRDQQISLSFNFFFVKKVAGPFLLHSDAQGGPVQGTNKQSKRARWQISYLVKVIKTDPRSPTLYFVIWLSDQNLKIRFKDKLLVIAFNCLTHLIP